MGKNNQIIQIAIVLLISIFVLFTGCIPKKVKSGLPEDIPKEWHSLPKVSTLPITASLLDLIQNEKLKCIVKEALKNNPNLRATALRLNASDLLLQQTRSRRMPSASLSGIRARDNHGYDPVTERQVEKNRYGFSLTVNWELDLWGKLSDEHNARVAMHKMKEQDYISAYDSLAARVIQSWINAVGLMQSIEIEEQRLQALETIENMILQRYRNGLGNLDELSSAQSRANVARSDISRLKEDHYNEIRSLEVLLGRYPAPEEFDNPVLTDISLPSYSTPLSVLNQRPDIRAAIASIEAGTLTAVAARKKMLPTLSINYERSRKSSFLSSLRDRDILWNLIANMVQPLFEGKRLVNEAKAARFEADAGVAELKALVLKSVKEVEDSAGREIDLKTREKYLSAALAQAEKSTAYYRMRYSNGIKTLLELLSVVEQEMNIKGRLVDVRSARMKNRVDLALALGIGPVNPYSNGVLKK
jgi:outer membrane protein, multidrug efflux system